MSPHTTALLIDDDRLLLAATRDLLAQDGIAVAAAHSLAEATERLSERAFDVVLLDQRLPDGLGHTLCRQIATAQPSAKIVFTTAYPSFENVVVALREGAHDYLSKPFDVEELRFALRRVLSVRDLERRERAREVQDARATRRLSGDGPSMQRVRDLVEVAARAASPALITGETGTGKSLVAKRIHEASARARGPFVSLNVAALPESLLEAELFGWERGSFTGAQASREGLVELADGGTLFLDEIGEMPLHLQAKLLALLEDREVRRLGGRSVRAVDVRFLVATNVDLDAAITARRFREDLYYRLDVLRIALPALRDRLEDLPGLCEELLRGLAPGRASRLAPGELARLATYDWPGNVRELRNVLERSLLLHGEALRPSELMASASRRPGAVSSMPAEASSAEPTLTLDELERRHVTATFAAWDGNLARTARALGVSLSTLKRKARAFGLRPGGAISR
jgi:DNA-binding NtrC family response regulator